MEHELREFLLCSCFPGQFFLVELHALQPGCIDGYSAPSAFAACAFMLGSVEGQWTICGEDGGD
jgi:hypothetical protein